VLQLSELYPSLLGAPAPGDAGSARMGILVDQAAEEEQI
jgi:hypothetical protein